MESKPPRWKPKVDKQLNIRVDTETIERLDRICQKWKATRGEAVRRLIKEAKV